MNRRIVLSGLLSALWAAISWAGSAPPVVEQVLQTGKYSAHVKTMPCDGCPAVVEETFADFPGIEAAKVNAQTSSVIFSVKPDALVKLAELQTHLKGASEMMGMGADFTLSKLKKVN